MSFDDDHVDSWWQYRSLLDEFGVKATFFVRGLDRMHSAERDLLLQLARDGHELGSHGYRHRSVTRHYNADPARIDEYLAQEVIPAARALREAGLQAGSYAFPYGHRSGEYDAAVLQHFSHLRSIGYRRRYLPPHRLRTIYHRIGSGEQLHHALGLDNAYANDGFLHATMRKAQSQGMVLSLFAHRINESDEDYVIRPTKLRAALQLAASLHLPSYTVGQLI